MGGVRRRRRGRGAHEAIHHRGAGRASSPDQGRLCQARAKAVERAARSAGARIPRDVRTIPVAALIAARPRLGEQGRADFCGAVRRNARGLGAIADFLPLVFAQRPVEHEQLLLHQQRAMPADDFRNWRLLLAKPLSSAFAPGPDQAVNAFVARVASGTASQRTEPSGRRASIPGGTTMDCASTLPHEAGRWHVSGRSGAGPTARIDPPARKLVTLTSGNPGKITPPVGSSPVRHWR
jgi:hypothetical protein